MKLVTHPVSHFILYTVINVDFLRFSIKWNFFIVFINGFVINW